MELADLLHGLAVRAPWLAAGRIIIQGAGFATHRGYDKTIRSALTGRSHPDQTALLEIALKEHLVAGEKLVRLVKIKPSERATLTEWIISKRKTSNALTEAFPGVAPASELKTLRDAQPTSVGYLDLDVGIAAIFTSVRSYLDHVKISPNKLKAGEADGYEEIIAKKRVYVQTYDAVWLPDDGNVVCLAADLPENAPSGFAKESQRALEGQVRRALGRPIEIVNFWPAVEGLYKAKEGKLVAYGFVNNADAVKHHTARGGGQSLWEDIYDKAGAAAVGDDLQLFKIAIAWARAVKVSVKAQPEILLPGTAKLLSTGLARLEHAIVRNCLNSRDLNFVLSRLESHVE